MKERILELISEIEKFNNIIKKNYLFYENFKNNEFKLLGKSESSAVILASILVNSYTCIETLFLKISKFFENSLRKDRWHTDLLAKMTLEISGIRKKVISNKTHLILLELMKFRHFTRYYFEFEHDWDKLDFLEKKYNQLFPLLDKNILEFKQFLDELIK